MDSVILKCENLHKKIGRKDVIKDVSFDLKQGDVLGFIGPNGAGKTTTIKLILGLQKLDKGTVIINGYDIKKDFEKAIEKVGAIVENPEGYLYLSGYKNLKLAANLYKGIDEKRIKEVVKLVGLENRIKDKVSKYSLGMRQRLGIAEAIIHKPNILILDEPTNGLDPEGIKDLREILIKLAKEENIAIFISSHNLTELESFCNRICIIQKGEILEEKDIKELKEKETSSYVMEVENTDDILNIIQDKKIEILNKTNFRINLNKEELSEFITKLYSMNIKVYETKKENVSLEEAFLKRTGGNKID